MAEQDNIPTSLQQRYELKKITRGELRKNLLKFKKEFQKFDPKVKILTPQADFGIGPVQYNLTLRDTAKISKEHLNILNTVIQNARSSWAMHSSKLMQACYSWLLAKKIPWAFCRLGVEQQFEHRCKSKLRVLQPPLKYGPANSTCSRTRKILEKEKLAFETGDAEHDDSESICFNLIRATDSQPRPPNPAEFALICDAGQPLDEEDDSLSSQHVNYTCAYIKGISKSYQILPMRRLLTKFQLRSVRKSVNISSGSVGLCTPNLRLVQERQ